MSRFAVETTPLAGLVSVQRQPLADSRGFLARMFCAQDLAPAGWTWPIAQINHTHTLQRGTVRGLHFQRPPHAQEKLIRVAKGRILDVVVDIRKGSPTYGKHIAVELNDTDGRQLYVPAGFAHGFCTLVPDTEVIYKVTDFWSPDCEDGVLWNDPALAIAWPDFAGAQLAVKDVALAPLSALDSPFTLGHE